MELLIFLNSRGLHCHSLQKMSLEKMWLLESRVISGQQSCRLVGEINGKWSLYVLNYEIDKKMDKNKSCLKFDRQPAITWVTGSKLGPFSSSTANWNIFHSIIRVATAPFLTRHGIYVLFWSVCLAFRLWRDWDHFVCIVLEFILGTMEQNGGGLLKPLDQDKNVIRGFS